jgi:hypothetical protein
VTVRDGRAKRDGDGGGVEAAAAVRLLCCFFHLFARSRAATSTYKAFFFSFQRACGANCDIPCWLGRTTTRAKAAAAHCKRLDETENDNVLLT